MPLRPRPRGRTRGTDSTPRVGGSRLGTKLMVLLLSAVLVLLLLALGFVRGLG
ncbi:hypothetical protein U4E84_08285 [Halorubrum sp. AD140]|uniref:hypothetical protein n=1 Tax=Halorubrum sp. AD140 TaxID=3050073 RepID=UPI002ACC5FB5|nr:hypothetical protein [Halorubrum sp. AD140]MDZ5811345.1 hypothetical protein [Halorubrum sp. AD140]